MTLIIKKTRYQRQPWRGRQRVVLLFGMYPYSFLHEGKKENKKENLDLSSLQTIEETRLSKIRTSMVF